MAAEPMSVIVTQAEEDAIGEPLRVAIQIMLKSILSHVPIEHAGKELASLTLQALAAEYGPGNGALSNPIDVLEGVCKQVGIQIALGGTPETGPAWVKACADWMISGYQVGLGLEK